LKEGAVSLVEIDLLRDGQRVLSVPQARIPSSHRTPYQICVHRGWKPETYEFYRVPLRGRLPTFSLPLREKDRDVPLDLQRLIDQCHENGAYDDIDYTCDPVPPLEPQDAAWADALLREKGLRR
jgi:hypothetical protein